MHSKTGTRRNKMEDLWLSQRKKANSTHCGRSLLAGLLYAAHNRYSWTFNDSGMKLTKSPLGMHSC